MSTWFVVSVSVCISLFIFLSGQYSIGEGSALGLLVALGGVALGLAGDTSWGWGLGQSSKWGS